MKLPEDFTLNRYGVYMRLVKVEDAEFIVKLRSNPVLGKYLHSTDDNIDQQKRWILDYKKRENAGLEYYFIFYKEDVACGVERIYNITLDSFTIGSWIFKKGLDPEIPILSNLLTKSLAFDLFPNKVFLFDVRKGNIKTMKYQMLFNPIKIGEDELNYYYRLPEANYRKAERRLLSILNY